MSSKGWVMAVERTPLSIPAVTRFRPFYFISSYIMQQKPAKKPSLRQEARPPLKKPLSPSFWWISLTAPRILVYWWKSASSKRVSMMLRGLVMIVLTMRAIDESMKSLADDCYACSKWRRMEKQMQHPMPALAVAAYMPLQNPLQPSCLMMYRQATTRLRNTLLVRDKFLGGIIRAILMFSKGWRSPVVSTPDTIPQSPLSLIMVYIANHLYNLP